MADSGQATESILHRLRGRGDLVSNIAMLTAAAVAIGGFGVIFSLMFPAKISDPHEILRLASQEFVAGRPVVAGELAETAVFQEQPDALDEFSEDSSQQQPDPPEASDQEEPATDDDADGETMDPAVRLAIEERQRQAEWVRLRDFLVGAGKVAKADLETDLRTRRQLIHDAVPYLERVRRDGFPPGRQAAGNRILGESLAELGRYDEAIVALQTAIQYDPTLRRDLLPLLAQAQLHSLSDFNAASLQTIEKYLADSALLPIDRWKGELIRICALIELRQWPEAEQIIQSELATEPVADLKLRDQEAAYRNHLKLLKSVTAVRRAIDRYGSRPQDPYEDRREVMLVLQPSIASLNDLQREASPRIASRARLWEARALMAQGMLDDAVVELTTVRQQRPFGAEAIMGSLEEIELLAEEGRGVEMLQTTRFVMRELGDARGFDAELISFKEFQRRLAAALEQLRRQGEYESAIDTARSLPPVFDKAEALTQEGIAYREWAAQTIADGTDITGQVARSASSLARARYRAAGDAFSAAAELQFDTPQYLPTQWSAIDAYQKGRHFSRSIRLLEPYLRYEQRNQQPRGLVAYGRALLAEDRPDQAIDALTTCIIEFPRDPLRYDARLLAALAYAEKGDLENARSLLMDNLHDGSLTPQSRAWRDSLLTLGELLYERGYRNYLLSEQVDTDPQQRMELLRDNQPILRDTVRYLDEAVERYWKDGYPRAEVAAYLSARAHLLSSRWPRMESQSPDILDAARRSLRAEAEQYLQTALDGFVAMRKHLTNREEDQRLGDGQKAMLRNCYLAEADVLREMEKWAQAAAVYRAVELRYINEPPALEAILGRTRCLRNLGREDEADLLIRQAAIVLSRIPPEWDGRFAEITRYDRKGWEDYIAWMNQRLDNQITSS